MRILFYDMLSYTYRDTAETLRSMGHTVHTVTYRFQNRLQDNYFCDRFRAKLSENAYDLVFSINFFPLVAQLSYEAGLPYVSWSYDSPLSEELFSAFSYETNFIFLFDRAEVEQCKKMGYRNVFHCPLAVNVKRLQKLHPSVSQKERFSSDLSFVGKLYDSSLEGLMAPLDHYLQGFLQALLDAQLMVYGCDLITPALTEEVLERINTCYRALAAGTPADPARTSSSFRPITAQGLAFALQKQITFAERVGLLEAFGSSYNVHFHATEDYPFESPVHKLGPVKYHTEMPLVFRLAKLNLCPTLRCILSGIPLRSLDILGSGGVLLSNYQPELAEYFKDGEEVILYGSLEEALDKAAYYLEHEELRSRIALAGQAKVAKEFHYEKMLGRIFQCISV